MTKRLFDVFFSLVGIIFLSAVFVFVCIVIKLSSKGPIIFKQLRVGQFGEPVGVLKFRTMVVNAELLGPKITTATDSRITPIGKILRKYKLDELPQLFNVLFGSMSLVGPRPEVQEFIDEYPWDIRLKVLSVKPGITDLASIEFKNENDILTDAVDARLVYINEILPIKQQFYTKYVDEQSLYLDLSIILKTINAIFRK